jgi:hypothetical protein
MRMGRCGVALCVGALGAILWIAPALCDETAPAAPTEAASPLEATFANTVRIKGKDGEVLVYFNRDGTFTSRGAKGDQFGTWKIVGDKVCTHTKAGGDSCGIVQPNRSVGDKWSQEVEGETLDVEIIRGR